MLLLRRIACAFLVCGVGAVWAAPVEQPVTVVNAEFGTFQDGSAKETVFEPTLQVPHRQGQRYGWLISLRTRLRSVSVSEEYLLPGTAQAVPTPESSERVLVVPQPRRNQVSQRQLVPVEGMISGEWAVGPNEPAGRRALQVLIEGQVAAIFEFEVK